jgi:hypothetical protein
MLFSNFVETRTSEEYSYTDPNSAPNLHGMFLGGEFEITKSSLPFSIFGDIQFAISSGMRNNSKTADDDAYSDHISMWDINVSLGVRMYVAISKK